MLIYISGAISSDPYYKRKFADAEKVLTKKGHDVINPAYIATALPKMEHEQYLHIDKALIDICDAVYFLKDWGSSDGAREEYIYVIKENDLRTGRMMPVVDGIQRMNSIKPPIKLIFEGENEKENEDG